MDQLTETGSKPHVRHIPVPRLETGNVVIMDNLSSHKRLSIKKLMEDAGVTLILGLT